MIFNGTVVSNKNHWKWQKDKSTTCRHIQTGDIVWVHGVRPPTKPISDQDSFINPGLHFRYWIYILYFKEYDLCFVQLKIIKFISRKITIYILNLICLNRGNIPLMKTNRYSYFLCTWALIKWLLIKDKLLVL